MDLTHDIFLLVLCSIIVAILWYKKLMPKHVNIHEVKEMSEDIIKLV